MSNTEQEVIDIVVEQLGVDDLIPILFSHFEKEFVSGNPRTIDQVVSPILWEKGIHKMKEQGIEEFIEIGCGKTLTGMNRKIFGVGLFLNIGKVEDLGFLEQALGLKIEMNA